MTICEPTATATSKPTPDHSFTQRAMDAHTPKYLHNILESTTAGNRDYLYASHDDVEKPDESETP
jgi:hypothetical protein